MLSPTNGEKINLDSFQRSNVHIRTDFPIAQKYTFTNARNAADRIIIRLYFYIDESSSIRTARDLVFHFPVSRQSLSNDIVFAVRFDRVERQF